MRLFFLPLGSYSLAAAVFSSLFLSLSPLSLLLLRPAICVSFPSPLSLSLSLSLKVCIDTSLCNNELIHLNLIGILLPVHHLNRISISASIDAKKSTTMSDNGSANGGNSSNASRHEKSLGLLTTRFVSLLQDAKDGVLDLKVVR